MKPVIYTVLLLGFLALYAVGCGANKQTDRSTTEENSADLAAGFQVLETSCLSCHSAQPDMEQQLAPPMVAIKMHYITDFTSLDEFTHALTDYVSAPDASKSKMPGAIAKFGLMPKMNFTEAQLANVAAYLYHTEIEEPEWFQKHYETERQKYMGGNKMPGNYLMHGQQLAMHTKSILGKNLMQAIQAKGTAHAVSFCNTRAITLTDSMAQLLQAQIKRVSDKPRNTANEAKGKELEYIQWAKEQLAQNGHVSPQLQEIDGKQVAYYPIVVSDMCLQCHGVPNKEIKAETLEKLATLYPNDKATGYQLDELRGIWVVEMDAAQ